LCDSFQQYLQFLLCQKRTIFKPNRQAWVNFGFKQLGSAPPVLGAQWSGLRRGTVMRGQDVLQALSGVYETKWKLQRWILMISYKNYQFENLTNSKIRSHSMISYLKKSGIIQCLLFIRFSPNVQRACYGAMMMPTEYELYND